LFPCIINAVIYTGWVRFSEARMTADDVILIFERLSVEGRADVPIDYACAGFAGWLADNWGRFEGEGFGGADVGRRYAMAGRVRAGAETKKPSVAAGLRVVEIICASIRRSIAIESAQMRNCLSRTDALARQALRRNWPTLGRPPSKHPPAWRRIWLGRP
jgi:hypothetical protein